MNTLSGKSCRLALWGSACLLFEDHAVIPIWAGTPVGCWTCHNESGGEDHDDDD
jgi:hypothetical protein